MNLLLKLVLLFRDHSTIKGSLRVGFVVVIFHPLKQKEMKYSAASTQLIG